MFPGARTGDGPIHELADLVASARGPEQVEAALVRLAGETSDVCRVELLRDGGGGSRPAPQQVAAWPEGAPAIAPGEADDLLGYPLCLGLRCGDDHRMTLRVHARTGRSGRWPGALVRRLTTLCALAAAAERGFHAGRRWRVDAPDDTPAAVRDATFLCAVLPYALSQARRHREPLAVVCVAIDRLPALARSHGPEVADVVVRRVAEAVAATLRGSDVVARLDDDRIIIVLPDTGGSAVVTVTGVIRSAVAEACLVSGPVPAVSASLGVSRFPDDARDMVGLIAAADEAMAPMGQGGEAGSPPPPAVGAEG